MTGKERVMKVFNHEKPDRMPCFCVNGTPTYEQMDKVGAYWPEGHERAEDMAKLAIAAYTVLGFDAVRAPFCQTFEAEALGCKVKLGGRENIPGIDHPTLYKVDDAPFLPDDFLQRGRIPQLIEAIRIMKREVGDKAAIIGGIIGPFTIAGAMLDAVPILKASFKTPDKLHPFLDVAEKAGTLLGKALIEAGADLIAVEDMQASPDLIAPHTYRDLELEYQKKQVDALSVPVILHICGNVDKIIPFMHDTGCAAISLEPKSDTQLARKVVGPSGILIGGVDAATTLFMKSPDVVKDASREQVDMGLDVLAPGCAIAPGTPTANLLAMVQVAEEYTYA
ncbi:MtaA/CmuA family methyltransferase [Desulfomonile tiedjei]|uniref:Methanol-specific methylcobalamin: coenzyme M methyltransferase n=1 Tax=Desulfomonile tiedjei (strain ATCC 49306 / DSM 6799 / DCB-1) TaxID=706587 RepID=I4C598_DESTA|nr:MtaA/CmuA family methyltransferase [Desulfomonile tiedjei]AFM24739.1 methanol-specific methylcobalamin: coenzyme M methyltransferase [Desulfomonile tiedjei DSM 6799]